jgi:hypothetical protein
MAINYVYNGEGMLTVNDGATLTLLPGTTIRFTKTGNGIDVKTGATVKMLGIDKLFPLNAEGKLSATPGTASGHVVLKASGSGDNKWRGVEIASTLANELNYVEILNAGNGSGNAAAALYLNYGKAAVRNCVIDGSKANGIGLYMYNNSHSTELTEFTGNVIKNSDKYPIYSAEYGNIHPLRNISNDNTFTGHASQYDYIYIAGSHSAIEWPSSINITLKSMNGYPWYFADGLNLRGSNITLTIEPGTDIVMGSGKAISTDNSTWIDATGTEELPVTIRGFNDVAGYWTRIYIDSTTPGTKFNWCNISGGGTANYGLLDLYSSGSVPRHVELNNVTFSKSAGAGLRLTGYSPWAITTGDLSSVTFTGCNPNVKIDGAGAGYPKSCTSLSDGEAATYVTVVP